MTGRGPDRVPSRELLADLDAGLLAPARAAEVHAAAARDPHAESELAALAAIRAELGALPDPPVPKRYAARWDAALAAEAAAPPTDTPSDTGVDAEAVEAPPRPAHPAGRPSAPRRRLVLGVTAALAAAAAAGVLWTPAPPAFPSLDRVDLVAAGLAAVGTTDVGEFTDPGRLAACLRAVAPPGVAADAELLGGRRVTLDGRPAVLLVLSAGGPRPGVDIVVVDPACGPDGGTLLGRQSAGG
jgi:hypothetical protein